MKESGKGKYNGSGRDYFARGGASDEDFTGDAFQEDSPSGLKLRPARLNPDLLGASAKAADVPSEIAPTAEEKPAAREESPEAPARKTADFTTDDAAEEPPAEEDSAAGPSEEADEEPLFYEVEIDDAGSARRVHHIYRASDPEDIEPEDTAEAAEEPEEAFDEADEASEDGADEAAAEDAETETETDEDGDAPRPLFFPFVEKLKAKIKPKSRKKRRADGTSGNPFSWLAQSLAREFKPIAFSQDPLERRRQYLLLMWRQRGAAGTLLLLHALITIVLMIIWAVLPRHVMGVDRLAIDGAMFSTLLIQLFAVLLPSAFVMITYNMDIGRLIGRSRQTPAVYALSALIGVPAAIAFTGLNNVTLFFMYSLGLHPEAAGILSHAAQPSAFARLLLILVTALVPAISEELMFRGVIQSSLSLSGRKNLAIFLMATAFSLYHNDPYFIVAPFCAGLYLGYMRDRSDNIYTGMLTHFVMNASLVLLQPILPVFTSSMAFAGTAGRTVFYASLIAAAVSLVLLIPLTSTLYSYCGKQNPAAAEPVRRRLPQEEWFPADWKFLLALFILFVTMLVIRSA